MQDLFERADWDALRSQLLDHSERVRGDGALLQALGLRLEQHNIVEFGPAALSRLEAAREREVTARQEIEQIARANFAAQAQTHAMAVDILEARNNSDLAARVHEAAVTRFGMAAGALSVEGPGPVPAGWEALSAGLVDTIVGPYAWRMGPAPALSQFFGAARAEGLKSAALVRLHLWSPDDDFGGRAGVLAFGSKEEDGFSPDMGGELVAFLAKVVERTAERWPPIQ